jgi:hypothetical protein
MDTEAFLPVSSEELTSGVCRRVIDFANLVNDVCNALVSAGLADLSNFRPTAAIGWTGRWFYLSGAWCSLSCDLRKWWKLAATPLWLTVFGPKFKSRTPAEVRRVLASLEAASPTRLYRDDDDDYTVPLFVPINVERAAVLEELTKQAKEVAHLLKGFGTSAVPSEGVLIPPDGTEIPGDRDT